MSAPKSPSALQRLRPWQRLPDITCERCEERATWRIIVAELHLLDPGSADRPGAIGVVDRPGVAATLACAVHMEAISDEFVERHGGVAAEPLQLTWLEWLMSCMHLGRLITRSAGGS